MTRKASKTRRRSRDFSKQDWRDIYDALMDAASVHHSGALADRFVALARRVREEKIRDER